jgi:Protein of unknown function (DUF2946)
MFAILLQALLLPVGQHPAGAEPVGLGGDTIAGFDIAQSLCHSPGDATPDDPGKAPVDHQDCCALCLAAHTVGSFAPPMAPTIAVSRDYGLVVQAETAPDLPAQRVVLRQQQPRAPPSLI